MQIREGENFGSQALDTAYDGAAAYGTFMAIIIRLGIIFGVVFCIAFVALGIYLIFRKEVLTATTASHATAGGAARAAAAVTWQAGMRACMPKMAAAANGVSGIMSPIE